MATQQHVKLVLAEFLFLDSSDDDDFQIYAQAVMYSQFRKIPRVETFMQTVEQYNDDEVSNYNLINSII